MITMCYGKKDAYKLRKQSLTSDEQNLMNMPQWRNINDGQYTLIVFYRCCYLNYMNF